MATQYKILGQAIPATNTLTTLYTCPSGSNTVVSTITICNQANSATFRIAVNTSSYAVSSNSYIVYDNFVNQYDSVFLTLGLTVGANDKVSVYSSTPNVSFNAFGTELTP